MPVTADQLTGYQPGRWTLDANHSEIGFSARHLAISKVKGVFDVFDATINAPEDPNAATVTAKIEVASVNTKQAMRDDHLRASDFFAVDEHPHMTFASTSIHWERGQHVPLRR